jgi:hypothetical protein
MDAGDWAFSKTAVYHRQLQNSFADALLKP